MAEENVQLASAAEQYFRNLPGLKYPEALTKEYPRIANRIFELKDDKRGLREYFESLANDMRGGRRGFPFGVLMNIQDLREAILGEGTGFVLDDSTKWVS
jgi:hypothetical protein